MNDGTRRTLMVAVPLLAVATMAIGLRAAAGRAQHVATVWGAPLPRPREGVPTALAWQVRTIVIDGNVREILPFAKLIVLARSGRHEARWEGASNEEGVAEIDLVLPDIATGAPLSLEVREEGRPEPLAKGDVTWSDVLPRYETQPSWVRPARREGDVELDVVVEVERLVPGFPTPVWVRATAGAPHVPNGGVLLGASPEPGLEVASTHAKTCDDGYAEVSATALSHVTGIDLHARFEREGSSLRGSWFGALPVAPGAFFVNTPRQRPVGKPSEAIILAPNPRKTVYVELDDDRGRILGAALPLTTTAEDPLPRARLTLPPLGAGVHWLVTSGDASGAVALSGATLAKPLVAGTPPEIDPRDACQLGPWLASHPARGFPRWIALEGDDAQDALARGRRARGRMLAASALALGALAEVLLLLAVQRGRGTTIKDAPDEDRRAIALATKSGPGVSLLIAVLVALLGFALLGALLLVR